MWSRPSLPQLLLLLPYPPQTSFLLTTFLLKGNLPLFLPQLLNLSLTNLSLTNLPLPLPSPFASPLPLHLLLLQFRLLPQLPFLWLPQFQLLLLLSLLPASSMLKMSLDSSALDTRTSTQPRLKVRMLLE